MKSHLICMHVLLVLGSCIGASALNLENGDPCTTPNGEEATCIPLPNCTVIVAALDTYNPSAATFAHDSQCGAAGMVPSVCCGSVGFPKFDRQVLFTFAPAPATTTKPKVIVPLASLSDSKVCGEQKPFQQRITGGSVTAPNEFPWLVALEFVSNYNNISSIKCGGSLINKRYVLTAAHCLYHVEFDLHKAWLGAWNIVSEDNCFNKSGISKCGGKVQKLSIEATITHHLFNHTNFYNDIALLKLKKDVEFNDYIKPICIPSAEFDGSENRTYLTVAGWGITENYESSDLKLKVDVPVIPNEDCDGFLRSSNINQGQLCAGGEPGKDSCQGDSGGPLMRRFDTDNGQVRWYQEGLVSYGIGCAENYPAVYTRITKYVSWIERTIEGIGLSNGDPCETPNNETAKCIGIRECDVILEAIWTKDKTAIEFALKSKCGYDSQPLVCCGSSAYPKQPSYSKQGSNKEVTEAIILADFNSTALPNKTMCGLEREKTRVTGGVLTDFDEFPWLAALEYKSKITGENAGIRCGGSLINNRYVLTAAHCILDEDFELIRAWLGDWNIKTDQDCSELLIDECADDPVKLYLKEQIPHPIYLRQSGKNDIGLLRLERDIEYTEYIRPICLPPSNLPIPEFGTNMTVAGWGTSENGNYDRLLSGTTSDIKLKMSVLLVENSKCSNKVNNGWITANQLCAGEVEKWNNFCSGDSGGPLMRAYENRDTKQKQWYQEGVASYGVGCAKAGYPALYTRVHRYITWIIDTMY